MNPEQLLNDIEAAIVNRGCLPDEPCKIGFLNGHIICRGRKAQIPGFALFAYLSSTQIQKGLSSHQWMRLREKAWDKYKEINP